MFDNWQDPFSADQHYVIEQQLYQIKDVMLDGLQHVIERGEKLDKL